MSYLEIAVHSVLITALVVWNIVVWYRVLRNW
jgi:hypothetical protein